VVVVAPANSRPPRRARESGSRARAFPTFDALR